MTTALYRRYRPDTFEQVIGQAHVTDPLRAALRANRVTHAHLFSGPRGCGKTTSARILARCLNCANGPTDTPCGTCDSCRELATGGPGSLDVVEIDAASHGGVDDARDLRERATFAPVRDRYKIFIVDEAHMVTAAGFNALLKLVEEPPEHVKFVFATTEPEKVLGTIRSRTHHYPFRLVPPDVLAPYLQQLCTEEHIHVDSGVIPLAMRAGGGSVRDTLSVLDQLMAGAIDAAVPYATAVALLGYTDQALLDQTVDALAGGDGAAAYRVVERMVDSGHDPRRFVEDFLQRLRDLLIISVAGDGAAEVLVGTPADQLERMFVQARNWGPRHLSRAADLTDEALRTMTGATSPRLQLELLIGRILVPVPEHGVGAAAAQAGVDATLASAPVPGMVGTPGGGAPVEIPVSAGGGTSGRFGAREAREALARKRQESGAGPSGLAPGVVPKDRPVPGAKERPAPAPKVQERGDSSALGPGFGSDQRAHREQPDSTGRSAVDRPWEGQESGWPEAAKPTATSPAVDSESSVQQETRETAPDARGDSQAVRRAVPEEHGAAPEQGRGQQEGQPQPSETSAAQMADVQVAPPSGRDADMLRQRWPEVTDRLATLNRPTWAMIHQHGQLGAVDSGVAIVLLPTPGHVSHLLNGGRTEIVAKAIYEVTGLQLSVRVEVGQASGGRPVTAPSAPVNDEPPASGGYGSEMEAPGSAPFDRSEPGPPVAQKAVETGWPTAATPGRNISSDGVGSRDSRRTVASAWDQAAPADWGAPSDLHAPTDTRQTFGASTDSPVANDRLDVVSQPNRLAATGSAQARDSQSEPAGPSSALASDFASEQSGVSNWSDVSESSTSLDSSAGRVAPEASESSVASVSSAVPAAPAAPTAPAGFAAPAESASPDFADYLPGDPTAQWTPMPVKNGFGGHGPTVVSTDEDPFRPSSVSTRSAESERSRGESLESDGVSPASVGNEPEPAAPKVPSGWVETVAAPGGKARFAEDANDWGPFAGAGAGAGAGVSGGPAFGPFGRNGTATHAERAAQPGHPTSSATTNRTQPGEPGIASSNVRMPVAEVSAPTPQVRAAEDDSASYDDDDVETSGMVGLPAVLEILGGTVIDTQTTQGEY